MRFSRRLIRFDLSVVVHDDKPASRATARETTTVGNYRRVSRINENRRAIRLIRSVSSVWLVMHDPLTSLPRDLLTSIYIRQFFFLFLFLFHFFAFGAHRRHGYRILIDTSGYVNCRLSPCATYFSMRSFDHTPTNVRSFSLFFSLCDEAFARIS